jgi:hypothetical protein
MWRKRVGYANKLYKKWSDRYYTDRLEEYYKGKQWAGLSDEEADKRYVINLVFAAIETAKPSLIFYRPQIKIQPRPGRAEQFGNQSDAKAKLAEDTVQTFIDDPDIDFVGETSLALQEAHFRFGVVEVGYTADWLDNPNAGKPVLKEGKTENDEDGKMLDEDGKEIAQPDSIPENENLYVKHIPAHTFRVAISSKNKLGRNDWVGYYEWHYVEDVKRDKTYKNTANLKSTGTVSKDLRDEDKDVDAHHGMVKLWKIWDLRTKKRHVLADGHDKFLVEDRPFTFLPFSTIKFHENLNEFYPIPPVYNWLGPQDEVNEVRQAQKAHRSRFYRRYTHRNGAIEDTELEKLETGGDGVYAKSNLERPIEVVPDAPLGADVWQHLDESKNDFNTVAGSTSEQRGVAEADTATQANIIDTRAKLREASARTKVADWLADIARLILLSCRDNMAMPIWVKRQVDPFVQQMNPAAGQAVQAVWEQIHAEALEDLDTDIYVELASMSPVTEDVQRNAWNAVLMLMTNGAILSILAMSEPLLRKTLNLYGIKNENEIQEIKKVIGQIMEQQQQAAQMAAMAGKPGAAGGRRSGQSSSTDRHSCWRSGRFTFDDPVKGHDEHFTR